VRIFAAGPIPPATGVLANQLMTTQLTQTTVGRIGATEAGESRQFPVVLGFALSSA
jgi:hypothetical protein